MADTLSPELPPDARPPRGRARWARAAALAAGSVTAVAALLGWRPAIAPVHATGTASLYISETIERGRVFTALGNCAICHTVEGGQRNAGGRWMETPFGRIVTTNLTPDPETGIGTWSFSAFQRAMREGISRDGGHLYPAVSIHELCEDHRRQPVGSERLPDEPAGSKASDAGNRNCASDSTSGR